MTISRERTTATTAAPGQAQFTTPDARQDERGGWILVGDVPRQGSTAPPDRLYLIAEPVGALQRAGAVGAGVLAAIRDIYGSSEREDPVVALLAALDAANLALYQQNLTTTPGRRVILGLTCLVARAEDLLICQVPPTQLIVSQGGTPIALPELASWQSDYQPHARDDRQGLGSTETTTPLLFRATLERGDLITLCTSNLARVLAEAPDQDSIGPLLGSDPAEAVAFLSDLAARHDLALAYATAVAPTLDGGADAGGRAESARDDYPGTPLDEEDGRDDEQGGGWFERGLREMRERSRIIPWPRLGARPQQRRAPLRAVPDEPPTDDAGYGDYEPYEAEEGHGRPIAGFGAHSAVARDEPYPQDTRADDGWDDEPEARVYHVPESDGYGGRGRDAIGMDKEYRATAEDPEPYQAVARPVRHRPRPSGPLEALGSLATLFLLAIGTVAERIVPTGGRQRGTGYLERSRNRIWPLGGLERYRSGGPVLGRKLPILIGVAIVVLAALLLLSIRNHQISAERARFDAALAKVTDTRVAALASPDRQGGHLQLLALPAQLAAIPAADKPGRPELIAAERAALAVALDQVDGVQRVPASSVQLLAPLPTGAGAATARPQIVVGDGKQYLLYNGTVSLVDGGKGLTKILAKGDTVAGVGVGTILGIAWRIDSLCAYSETQGFVRDGAGNWTALPLAASGRKGTAVDSFAGNLYLLEAERGQIVKFASGSYNQAPQPWSSSKTNADLGTAVDFTIDGDIYALLGDGRVIDLYQGETKATYAPTAVPPLAGASALTTAGGGKWLYMVDPREGRIVRIGRDGTQVAIFKPGDGAKSFAGAREIAVDETSSTAYVVTDEGVLSVRLP